MEQGATHAGEQHPSVLSYTLDNYFMYENNPHITCTGSHLARYHRTRANGAARHINFSCMSSDAQYCTANKLISKALELRLAAVLKGVKRGRIVFRVFFFGRNIAENETTRHYTTVCLEQQYVEDAEKVEPDPPLYHGFPILPWWR